MSSCSLRLSWASNATFFSGSFSRAICVRLRRLSLSTLLFFCCNEVWATQTAFRMGVLNWVPMTISHFTSAYDLFGVVSQGTFGNRLLARMGNRASMEVGALVSLVSCKLCSSLLRFPSRRSV